MSTGSAVQFDTKEIENMPAKKKAVSTDKAAKFKQLANKRVPNAMKALRRVANLGNYPVTKEQAEKIMLNINSEVDAIEARLKAAVEGKVQKTEAIQFSV